MFSSLYKNVLKIGAPFLKTYLKSRLKKGKEDPARFSERMGQASRPRPEGKLIWIHAASVGETQSALILIKQLSEEFGTENISFLVTSVTVTSANLMAQRLPENAFHHYAPVDHPDWIRSFMDHWRPDMAVWVESELWPHMLKFLRKRHIPCVLVNARMSPLSFKRWSWIKGSVAEMLSSFDLILTQTEDDKKKFEELGAACVVVTDNLKYSSKPLPYDQETLETLQKLIGKRPVWIYASTHTGEEELACETHLKLKEDIPNLLTLLVPRHPERRNEILENCKDYDVHMVLRSEGHAPKKDVDIYVADTLGEMGLFYKLAQIAVVGRTFSDDGGGGHNPIEPALLGAATLKGKNYQNQTQLVEDMKAAEGICIVETRQELAPVLLELFQDNAKRERLVANGLKFAEDKSTVIERVMHEIEPVLLKAGFSQKNRRAA